MPETLPNEETIEKVCAYLRNWFVKSRYFGKIEIENGALKSTYGLKPNQYFRIVGSVDNDGIYQYPITTLTDEIFTGAIWLLSFPKSFLELLGKIETWETKFADVSSPAMSPFTSESVAGVYSYSKSASAVSDTDKDKSGTWQGVFGHELKRWRKL